MALSKRLQFTILAEGKRDYDFARTYLTHRYGRLNVECYRAQTVAAGRGSGEQQVRQRFPVELHALRAYSGKNRYLVVMIDGDLQTPEQRRQQVQVQAARTPDDRVLIIVPCRNLENWFAWLDDQPINEQHDYKPQYRHAKPTLYAKRLIDRRQAALRIPQPPSLHDACQELMRIH